MKSLQKVIILREADISCGRNMSLRDIGDIARKILFMRDITMTARNRYFYEKIRRLRETDWSAGNILECVTSVAGGLVAVFTEHCDDCGEGLPSTASSDAGWMSVPEVGVLSVSHGLFAGLPVGRSFRLVRCG